MDIVETTTGTVLIAAPIVIGLVGMFTLMTNNEARYDRWKPPIALVLGILIAFLIAEDLTTRTTILAGIISGLTASGLYSGGKAVAGK